MNQPIESLLIKSQLAVNRALHSAQISNALFSSGYNEDLLSQGKNLIEFVKQLRTQSNGRLFEMLDHTNHLFEKHVKLARIVFIDDQDAWTVLNLYPYKSHSSEKWILQAQLFYTHIVRTPLYVEAMRHYGIEKIILDSILANLRCLEKTMQEDISFFEKLKIRDHAYDNLQTWMLDFESKARVALRKTPDTLRSLGIVQNLSF